MARTAAELVPIAGYYRRLVHAQERMCWGMRRAWDRGNADFRECDFYVVG